MKALSTKRWKATRQKWIVDNPVTEFSEDGDTGWICAFCGDPVWKYDLSLDHILRVQDYPQCRYDTNNLRPMHQRCNSNLDAIWRTAKGIQTFTKRKRKDRYFKRQCIFETLEWYRLAISIGAMPHSSSSILEKSVEGQLGLPDRSPSPVLENVESDRDQLQVSEEVAI